MSPSPSPTYPAREDVLAVATDWIGDIPEADLWWYDTVSGVRVPFAITKEAVDYYSDLIAQWKKDPHGYGSIVWLSATFKYKADVQPFSRYEAAGHVFTDVNVVHLVLKWSAFCGPMCAHAFTKERIVVLNANGDVLAIIGDGTTPLFVS